MAFFYGGRNEIKESRYENGCVLWIWERFASRGRDDRVGELKIFSPEPLKAYLSTLYLVMKRMIGLLESRSSTPLESLNEIAQERILSISTQLDPRFDIMSPNLKSRSEE
ncbi:hypothetical protein D1115_00075 [Vibrio alfacsensis]|uniref:Uncharacterized protein n=1 Tax=Vibrio alfacsensis TaxID=1074311 RepID=A0ABM6YQ49_9VIBR|nr:hypothetical protein D1115_00075 [Vibrio alfacsensis]